jgi:Ser/Thr protein kinase RdoA (MazF antagonist)
MDSDRMFPSPLDSDVPTILGRYPSLCGQGARTPLGNRGGFSGAFLWRINGPAGSLCLRAWPPHETRDQLLYRHRLMTTARQYGLLFVPAIFTTLNGVTEIEYAGRFWELTEWLPGRADFHESPSHARLEAACTALAQLHIVWQSLPSEEIVCAAVQRRLRFLDEWHHLMISGWRPLAVADRLDPLLPLVERAWRLLPVALDRVPQRLNSWKGIRRSQPCLCDLWHDHLLFEDDRLTGVIDYGAVKIDHVSVDLARLLGSLVADDADGWRRGLQAYRRITPLTTEEEKLAHTLDETGVVLGVANWLRRLYEERRPFADRAAVGRRLTELVDRLESVCIG